jgi:Nif-specific regulatory protein
VPQISIAVFDRDRLIRIVPVSRLPFSIGRARTCDLQLDHSSVSRTHARVVALDGRLSLLDAGSTNGLIVNGKAGRSFTVQRGDKLALGPYTLHFDPGETAGAGSEGAAGTGERPYQALQAMLALAAELGRPIDQEQLLEKMLDCLIQAFEADRGFVLLVQEKTGELVPAMARRFAAGEIAATISHTVAKEVARTAQPILIEDIKAQEQFRVTPSIAREGIRSILCAPIASGGQTRGVLYLDSPLAARTFLPADLDLLNVVAGHAARVLDAHREVGMLRRDRARWKAIQTGAGGASGGGAAGAAGAFEEIVGSGETMRRLVDQARRAAGRDITVLLLGESGTGKEVLARAIHHASARREGPFVAVNCAALAPGVVESELFGHEKGAFSGATERRMGRFELADGGTLFLDEVGEIPPDVQVKLLRALEERTIEPVGSNTPAPVDVRLLCATNADLEALVSRRAFRDDLFYRINVLSFVLPPLRERPEDIPDLVDHFVREMGSRARRSAVQGVDEEALALLMAYPWPGNIRELRNIVERALVLETSAKITPASLPFGLRPKRLAAGAAGTSAGVADDRSAAEEEAGGAGLLDRARDSLERSLILKALKASGGNVSKAAQQLGVHRMSLQRRLDALAIDMDRWQAEQDGEERERIVGLLRRHDGNLAAVAAELGLSRSTAYRRLKALSIDARQFGVAAPPVPDAPGGPGGPDDGDDRGA